MDLQIEPGKVVFVFIIIALLCTALVKRIKDGKKANEYMSNFEDNIKFIIKKLHEHITITTGNEIPGREIKKIIGTVSVTSELCGTHPLVGDELRAKLLLKASEVKADAVIGANITSLTEGSLFGGEFTVGEIESKLLYAGTAVQLSPNRG